MAAYVPVCRYLFNEAVSGAGLTTVFDNKGGHHLTMNYGTAHAEWNPYGLAFLSTAGTAIATRTNMSTAGSIGQLINNKKEITAILKMKARNGHSNYHRAFILSSSTSNGELGVTLGSGGNVEARFGWDYSGGRNLYNVASFSGRDEVWIFVFDTSKAIVGERCEFYVDNVLQIPVDASIGQNIILNSNNSDQDFCVGQRPSLNRGVEADFAYLEIGTGKVTSGQRSDIGTGLASNDNQDWQAGGVTPAPADPILMSGML